MKKVIFLLLLLFSLDLLLLWGIDKTFFFRQLAFWFLGLALLLIIVRVGFSLKNLENFGRIFYLLGIFLLGLPLLIGEIIRGSARWVFINNQSFQPSEFAKPVFVAFLAASLAKISRGDGKDLTKILLGIFLPIFLLLLEPNLGTALVFCFIAISLILLSRFKKRPVFRAFLFLFPTLLLVGSFLLADYQKARIQAFLNPWSDPLGKGYNLLQAQVAFGSGRFFGRGLGLGGQARLFFLPERHTDFIFASLGESFGFLGSSLLIVTYYYFFLSLWKEITQENDDFIFLLKTGLLASLWFQTNVNIAMNLGLLPISGLPLPFFSYGGSSLTSSLVALGLILKKG